MKKLHYVLLGLLFLFNQNTFSQELEFGFQASLPSYGLSLKANLNETHSAQVIYGALGIVSTLSGRYIYSFNETNDRFPLVPFVYAQVGSWTYDLAAADINESVFGYGFGAGIEFSLGDWISDRLSTTIELGYGKVDLESYDFKATSFGFGIHYKFIDL